VLDAEQSLVYLCPRCAIDTPHLLVAEKNSLLGVVCSHCHTASLVRREVLQHHQSKWERELKEILDSLSRKPDEDP